MRKNEHKYQMIEQCNRLYIAEDGRRVPAWCFRFQTPFKAVEQHYEEVSAAVTADLQDIFQDEIRIYSGLEERIRSKSIRENILKCEFRANYGIGRWEITVWMRHEFIGKLP